MRLHMNPIRCAALLALTASLLLGGCMTMPHKPPAKEVQARRTAGTALLVSNLTGLAKITAGARPRKPVRTKIASADRRATLIAELVAAGGGTSSCPEIFVPKKIENPDGYVPPVRLDEAVPLEPDTIEGLGELYCVYPELYCATTATTQAGYEACLVNHSDTSGQ